MEGYQSTTIWLNSVLIAFTLLSLCARVGRRISLAKSFSWHDALITLAAASAFAFSILQIVGTTLGLGRHQVDVNPQNMPKIIKLIITSNVFYFLCNWAVKHALLLFYSELVSGNKLLGCIYFMHFTAFGFGSSSIFATLFQCRPFEKAWRPKLPGSCINLRHFFYFNSSFMLATDLVLYIMPVVLTWSLQLRRTQRIGINCLFALGGLVLAASAARVHSVHAMNTKHDFSWWYADVMIWSVLENHLAIIVACAPSIKVIALLAFPRLSSSVGKVASRITSMHSREHSRASVTPSPFNIDDLKAGPHNRNKLRITSDTITLPSPAFMADNGGSRASQNFARWFRMPASPIGFGDNEDGLEEQELAYAEEMRRVRVQHTITVEEASRSSKYIEANIV